MIRGIAAITLALLIGNPFCCCALGLIDPSPATESPVRACCQGKTADLPGPSQDSETPDRPPCGCGLHHLAISSDKALKPSPPVGHSAPSLYPLADAAPLPRSEWNLSPVGPHGPPDELPGLPPVRILYGVFRC